MWLCGWSRGIHAGDPESYDTFIDIYRPCVERYHTGFKWDAEHAHRTDLSVERVGEDISEAAKGLIVSSRIRVARNLAAPFVMNPNGTAETRKAVLDMVRKCAETFPAELAGTVYAHADMTAAEEQQLIDDHILFKGRDARQAACGYHQYWPAGRGVFCSKDKTFNMWINEGDHLRIMCLFQGSDIKGVLGKLAKGIAAMEAAITQVTGNASPIAKHPILGCVTCCPTNLGTGCRASVMMDLPRLMAKLGLHGVDEVCAKNHCQARGSTGEFSEVTESARCDISNRYRLGYSEAELVAQMIRTANLLAKMESEVLDPMQDLILDESLARNEYPADKINKEKASLAEGKHCSHMAEYVSAELFELYKGLESGGLGRWTISRAINTGVQFPRAYM